MGTLTSATGYSDTQIRNVLDGSFIFGILYPLLTSDTVPEGFAPFLTTLDLKKQWDGRPHP